MKQLTKRLVSLILCALIMLSFCACGKDDPVETTEPIQTTEPTTVPTTVPVETTEPGPRELSSTEIAQLAGPATVTVHTNDGLGTGFFIDDKGTLVTCYHVIDGANALSVELSDGGFYDVNSIIDFSEMYDVAVLEVNIAGNAYLNVCEGKVIQGETVYALGSSRGLDGTFSNGVISAVDRKVGAITCVQTTAATSGGNSGGPLMNVYGEVVGINAMTRTDGQNLNYAIDTSLLEKLSMNKHWNMSEYQEWYDKEIKRSFLVYNTDTKSFEHSKVNTYHSVTGQPCLMSSSNWNPVKNSEGDYYAEEGYSDLYSIHYYEHNQDEEDQYTEYLKSIGFTYNGMQDYQDWEFPGTSYYYVNEFTGVCVDIYVLENDFMMVIQVTK